MLTSSVFWKKIRKKRRRDSDASVNEEDRIVEQRKSKRTKKQNPPPGEPGHDPYAYEEDENIDEEEEDYANRDETLKQVKQLSQSTDTRTTPSQEISDKRLQEFQKSLHKIFQETRLDTLAVQKIHDDINAQNTTPFSAGEIKAALQKMSDENKIMIVGDNIIKI